MRYLPWIVALLLTGTGLSQAAELGQQVRKDLAPLPGHVIAARTNDYLIDLDAADGVRSGDLFAVIRTGKSVSDPQTGKVLGHEEETAAVLRVTQVMRGFSTAMPMGRADAIRQGDAVRRYALLQTVFWDYTDQGENVYTEMRENLPNLRWLDYGAAQGRRPKEPAFSGTEENLLFILKNTALEIRDGQGRLIKAYKRKPDVMPVARVGMPVTAAAPMARAESEMIAALPMAVTMADFILDNGRNLLAATDENQVSVYAIGADAALQASWSPGTADRILTVRWWRPDRQAPYYLALTVWTEQGIQGPRGVILRWRDNALTPVATVVSSVMGAFDRDGDGVAETLLKQKFDTEYFFGRRVETLRLRGDKLYSKPVKETLPNGFTVTGSALADLDGDGKTEAAIIKNGYLFIYRGRKQVYKSPRKLGGSIVSLNYNATPGLQENRLDTARFELSPLWCDIDGDGQKELVVPAAEGVNHYIPGLPTKVDSSWLAVVRHGRGRFSTRELSETFERPIQGLGLSPQGVLFLTTQPAGDEAEHGQTTLYRFPIQATP
jgi:hypothetical protein